MSKQLARAIEREADEHEIDWKLIAAILFQESSLRIDPQNCLTNPKRCTGDYGIGQVRYKVWIKRFHIEKERLLIDPDYSVKMSVKVIADYKNRYAKKEAHWYTRYHSKTPEYRDAYMVKVNKVYNNIRQHLLSEARATASKD